MATTFSNLAIRTSGAPAVGGSTKVTLVVNGAETALTCTEAPGATDCTDAAHSVVVPAGMFIGIKVAATSGGTASDPLDVWFGVSAG